MYAYVSIYASNLFYVSWFDGNTATDFEKIPIIKGY